MVDRVGQQLGNYRIIRPLGQGGFAEVYLGEHLRLKTQAAIKILHTKLAGDDAAGFLSEAQTIGHLEHPHIVRVLDFDVKEGVPFLVMSYAPNGTLRHRHPKGTRLPLETILLYIKQIADALQYAHDEKLIHRDVKPENMLLGRRNEVLLSDFGIAIIAESSRYQVTQEAAGTVVYMAPEQVQGKPRPASDQYALGVVIYEWLCGSRPFQGTFTEVATQHVLTPPPPLHEKVPDIPPAIEKVVLIALAKDPHQRFASVQEFASAFERACQPPISSVSPTPLNHPSMPSEQPLISANSIVSPNQSPLLSSGPTTPLSHPPMPSGQPPIPASSTKSLNQSPRPSSPPVQPGSAALPSILPLPVTPDSPKRGISRRIVLASLVVLLVAGGGLTLLVLSLRPFLFPAPVGLVTVTGTIKSVDATNGSVTLTVNGQDVTINGLSSAQVAQLQSQVGKTYSITAVQNSDGSYTISTGSNTITIAVSTPAGIQTPGSNGTGSAGAPVAGTISFIGKVQSVNGNSIVVSMPNGSTLSMAIVNGQTDLSAFNNAPPAAGTVIKVDANANTDGSFTATKLGQILQSDLSNPTLLNTVQYQGMTTSGVGSDNVLHFTVGNKSYSYTIGSGAVLSDFNNNAQSIQANRKVTVSVLFNGSNGTVIKVA